VNGHDFGADVRLSAIESSYATRGYLDNAVATMITNGLSASDIEVIKTAINDTMVDNHELAAAVAERDVRIACLEAKLDAVIAKLEATEFVAVEQIALQFDCAGHPV
jgi:uncharacterized coiled-coil protein SlyX